MFQQPQRPIGTESGRQWNISLVLSSIGRTGVTWTKHWIMDKNFNFLHAWLALAMSLWSIPYADCLSKCIENFNLFHH